MEEEMPKTMRGGERRRDIAVATGALRGRRR